jgi:uncharacterized LabA/DUF88 family protein
VAKVTGKHCIVFVAGTKPISRDFAYLCFGLAKLGEHYPFLMREHHFPL